MNPNEVTQQAIDAVRTILKGGPAGVYQPGVGIVKDITQATGLVAYNLEPAARLLVPAITPLRNRIPRISNVRGGTAVNWKVITSLDISRVDLFTAEGTKASTVSYSTGDKSASFKTISKGDNVSFQAQWAGKTFEDVKARAISRLLKHVMIHEEQALLGAMSTMGAVSAPTVTPSASGGSIGAGTYNVYVRAVNNVGRGRKSSATSSGALSGSTNKIQASVAFVDGAVKYEWYVGTAGNEKLEATTQINSVELLSLAGTGAAWSAALDNYADALAFDGLLGQLTGGNNAQVRTLATGTMGAGTALSLDDIDAVFQNIWDNARANPDMVVVNSQQAIKVTNLVLAANGGPTLYVTNDKTEVGAVTGGYRVTHYINKVTGKPVPIEVHPYLNPGTMLILTMEMPFPASDIDNPLEVETRQDYMQIDYPITSPKWEFEVLLDEVLKVYFPGSCGVIRNIKNG